MIITCKIPLKSAFSITVFIGAALLYSALTFAANSPTTVRISINEPLLPQLAVGLGAIAKEGLELQIVNVEDVSDEDYLMQQPLADGKIDASFHWFQHVVFGARHNLSVKAVLMADDTPNMKILVANRLKGEIRSAVDFKGRNIAEGAGYATKSLITNYLAHRAGLPRNSYNAVMKESAGRLEAVLDGLAKDQVDVMSFMEPITSAIAETNQVFTLYDLTNRAGVIKAFGAPWPSHSLFFSSDYIEKNPEIVQHLVNALVRALRFMSSHTPEEIAAKLPAEYFNNTDRATALKRIRNTQSGYTSGKYAFSPDAVKLVVDAIMWSDFDESEEGRFRATGEKNFCNEDLYDNRFVVKAMDAIK